VVYEGSDCASWKAVVQARTALFLRDLALSEDQNGNQSKSNFAAVKILDWKELDLKEMSQIDFSRGMRRVK
jgi:hypothetical protein